MKTGQIILLLLCLFIFSAGDVAATEDFAERTGSDCGVCHLDPAGGGELTAEGDGYALSLGTGETSGTTQKPVSSRLFRLFIGYLHILFGFFWFGTILYVHLILKPAYASGGLPRGEVRLGLLSMVVMGVTGAILFAYRVPDTSLLLETRFGILLLLKILMYLIMVCSALFAVFFLGPRLRRKRAAAQSGTRDLSLDSLTRFDGKDGRPAYFAYRGEIFDATGSPLWKNGTHMGRHQAGCDLTNVLSQAPHEEDKVLALPKIGMLQATTESSAPTPPQKLFYAMAYMNLGIVLLILLILAGWKWW